MTREVRNSNKFRRDGLARWWHVTMRPFVRITWFRPVQRSSVEVISKLRCGFNRHQPLLESLSVTPCFTFSACQFFTGHSKGNFIAMSCSASKLLARSGCEVGSCSRFIVGICINFLVTSCIHLSLLRFHRLFTFYFVFIK